MARVVLDYHADDEVTLTVELSDTEVEGLLSGKQAAYGLLVADEDEEAPHRFHVWVDHRPQGSEGRVLCPYDQCLLTTFLKLLS